MDFSSYSEDDAVLPSIVDHRARENPSRLYGASTWIDALDNKLNLRAITYGDLSNAVNVCSQWLEAKLGKSTDYTTIAYSGTADYRYLIVTMAAAKTGHTALLLAPWNSTTAQIKLLETCNCNIFLAAEDKPMLMDEIQALTAQREMQVFQLPTLQWLLDEPEAQPYPFTKTLSEVRDQDYVIIHTSGSTGYPKPLPYKYGAMAALRYLSTADNVAPYASGPSLIAGQYSNTCYWLAFPPSHSSGVLGLGPFNIYFNMPMILGPGDRSVSPELATQMFAEPICEAAMMAPAHLQAISRNSTALEAIGKLKHVVWGGGPWTSVATAKILQSQVALYTGYGSSELGHCALIPELFDEYPWMHFHPIAGATFRHHSDDLYELVIRRDPSIEKAQFVFQLFPQLTEYPTKDLFSRHPTREELWRFRSRKDDLLVLGIGRNIEPSVMETAVVAHPKVEAALLGGEGRTKTCLLIEAVNPPVTDAERMAFVEDIWPTVSKANEDMNSFGRVSKELIIIAAKEKPFLRAGKGTIVRATTVAAYEEELENAFSAAEQ